MHASVAFPTKPSPLDPITQVPALGFGVSVELLGFQPLDTRVDAAGTHISLYVAPTIQSIFGGDAGSPAVSELVACVPPPCTIRDSASLWEARFPIVPAGLGSTA